MIKRHRTKNRLELIEKISNALTDKDDFSSLNYKTYNESKIKQSLNHFLLTAVREYYQEKGSNREQSKKAANECVFWEGTPTKTIHNRDFLGCNHRPDFEIKIDRIEIAVEVRLAVLVRH